MLNYRKKSIHSLFYTLLLGLFLVCGIADIIDAKLPSLLKPETSNVHYILQGVQDKVKANIEARLAVLSKLYPLPKKTEYEAFIQEAPEQILKAMQPYGYYKPTIKAALKDPGTSSMSIVFDIDPGPVMRVSQLSLIIDGPGKDEPFFQKIVTEFPLKIGEPLLISRYNLGKQQLIDTAAKEGYLKSIMSLSRVNVDLAHYTSEIIIHFNTGKRFYFGKIAFSKTPFSDEYLERYVPFKQGKPFASSELVNLQDALSSSDQFKQINVTPQYEQTRDQEVPILVNLIPQPAQSYTLGAGYGTDTGIRGIAGWNLLHLTPSGHKFQALVQASQLQDSVQAQYIIPGLHPTTEDYAITGSVYNLNYPGSKSNAAQVAGAYRTHEGTVNKTYSINALFERYTIEQEPTQDALLLYPSVNWKTLVADNPIFAKNGYSISFTTQGSAKELASSTSFAQAEVVAKWAKTIQPMHTRFYTRADLGITAVNDIDSLPPSLQFYTGGSQSVRGYSYQSLGPGKGLVVLSAEWQQEVISKGYLTFFYDAGNAFNESVQLMRSVGTGIMWVTPIGPLHLSFAKALDDSNAGSWHVVFSMGPDL